VIDATLYRRCHVLPLPYCSSDAVSFYCLEGGLCVHTVEMLVSDVALAAAEHRACDLLTSGIDPRVDLSSCVPSNHMVEHKLTAWVSLFPAVVKS
jgi:hypothetical protein